MMIWDIRKMLFALLTKDLANMFLCQAPAAPIYLVLKILSPSKTASQFKLASTQIPAVIFARSAANLALTTAMPAMKRRIKAFAVRRPAFVRPARLAPLVFAPARLQLLVLAAAEKIRPKPIVAPA